MANGGGFNPFQTYVPFGLGELSTRAATRRGSLALGTRMGEISDELSDIIEENQKRVKEDLGSGFFQLTKAAKMFAKMFAPPVLREGLVASIAVLEGTKKKGILKDLKLTPEEHKRFGKLFTKDVSKKFQTEAERLQMGTSDILKQAVGEGLQTYVAGEITGKIGESIKDAPTRMEVKSFKEDLGLGDLSAKELKGINWEELSKDPLLKDLISNLPKGTDFSKLFEAAQLDTPWLSSIMESMDDFSKESVNKDNLEDRALKAQLIKSLFGI